MPHLLLLFKIPPWGSVLYHKTYWYEPIVPNVEGCHVLRAGIKCLDRFAILFTCFDLIVLEPQTKVLHI